MEQREAVRLWIEGQLERTNMTQADLSARLGVSRTAVLSWIVGKVEAPADARRAMEVLFGVSSPSAPDRSSGPDPQIRWYHRRAHVDGGREFGNAAAFAFDADLAVLAREATQNSLDERLDDSRPVRLRYTLHELEGEHLERFLSALRWSELEPHYVASATSRQKVGRVLAEALRDLEDKRSLVLLRVDDYNAAGLTGPEYGDGRYAAVVRRQLDSHKATDRAAGSYGLGKATLWATSRLGLVLINSSLSQPHGGRTERRLVGRLDLPWREVDGESFAGPAWLGEPDNDPDYHGVSRSWWGDRETARELHLDRDGTEPGTSFLIVGAHDASGDAESLDDMHAKLVRSVADGFWAAMTGGRDSGPLLETSVVTLRNNEIVVPEERVDPNLQHPSLTRALRAYFDGETVEELTSGAQVVKVEVPLLVPRLRADGAASGNGVEHRAVLLVTSASEGELQHSRVVCMRGGRMTVEVRRPREIPLGTDPFQAVLLAGYATGRSDRDVELAEAFLRASEPPEHDRWDKTEELSSTYVRGALTRLRDFRSELDTALRRVVGRRESRSEGGPAVLRELLRLDVPTTPRRGGNQPAVQNVIFDLDVSGACRIRVEVKLPDSEDSWLLTPTAKFDVRSGARPTLAWSELTAVDNCRVVEGNLHIEAGVRHACFRAVTDPASHPVAAPLAGLIVDLHKVRGASR
ncbi:helix-turn-helix domain-containing protein [Kitasatospora sp. NPDC057223]|uniref:helix-turn-helix domain-containing protein n=1 Tax=Kitasatospora sp. NPDC057223 TaxID=3346055 RepID=UPI0036268FEA